MYNQNNLQLCPDTGGGGGGFVISKDITTGHFNYIKQNPISKFRLVVFKEIKGVWE